MAAARENDDFAYMDKAYAQAKKAFGNDEVPIGAVVVRNGEIVGRGFNKIELLQDPTAHAEIIAIKKAAKKIGTWILDECDLFVTVEPCAMCLGAIFQARIKRVVFGAANARYGAITTAQNHLEAAKAAYKREPIILQAHGEIREKCKNLLQTFFRQVRVKNRAAGR